MLVLVQGAENFFLGEVSVLAELGDGDVGPSGLVGSGADALQQNLGRAVFGAGELGHFLGVNANLGYNGVQLGKGGRLRYNGCNRAVGSGNEGQLVCFAGSRAGDGGGAGRGLFVEPG